MTGKSKETAGGSDREEDFGYFAIDKIIDVIRSIICIIDCSAKKSY
jgi:hypothetical protein